MTNKETHTVRFANAEGVVAVPDLLDRSVTSAERGRENMDVSTDSPEGHRGATQRSFVALERGTGRGIKQVIDRIGDQPRVAEKVTHWVREGFDVRYMDIDVAGLVPHE